MQEEIKNQETVDNTASEETNKKDKKKNKKADAEIASLKEEIRNLAKRGLGNK